MRNVIRRQCENKFLARNTQHIVAFDSILASIEQVPLALRIVLAEAFECAQILGTHSRRILDLNRMDAAGSINDEIDFHL